VSDTAHGQCLTEETLTDYLEGSLDLAVKAASEVHLVSCGDCRQQLAFFMRVLDSDVDPTEAGTLKTIAAEWDKRRGLSETPVRRFGLRGYAAVWGALAAALVISVVSVWVVRQQSSEPKSASEIVQLLLKDKRPFEARLADEPHHPILRTRGTDDSGVSYGLLAGEMTRLSANSHEMGRFHLLQKEFSRAIPYLENAEREVGASAAVHNDLGVAYLENGNAAQFEKAEQEFLHATREDASFATAVFNLALFYERINATDRATAQWKRYLELDSESDWAKEARGRLQAISR
jgi:tetratricopeptide (TPR) repeat protein